MDKEKFFNQIEAFLFHRMTPEEEKAFKGQLSKDPDLKEAYLKQALAHKGVELLHEDMIRSKLGTIRLKEGALKKPEADTIQLRQLLVRAAIIVLVAAVGLTIYGQTQYGDSKLAYKNYMQAATSSVAGDAETSSIEPIRYAFFQNQNYEEVLVLNDGILLSLIHI